MTHNPHPAIDTSHSSARERSPLELVPRTSNSALLTVVPQVRASVAAILKIRQTQPETIKRGKVRPASYELAWGSAFSVARDKYLVTAFHVLNGGRPRDPSAKYYALAVPSNGYPYYTFPVVGFPVERPDLDMAVLEIMGCNTPGVHLPALAVSFDSPPDGSRVVTMGFPAPRVADLSIGANGELLGGQFLLKSHANDGIVAAQYLPGGEPPMFEFNVGWHHGESGGPIVSLEGTPVVFSLMQQYRNIQGPHGIVAGPHLGRALAGIRTELEKLGVGGI